MAGRWYRLDNILDNPKVAQWFSASAAASNKLMIKGAAIGIALVVAQDLLDAYERGDDIISMDFGVDLAIDVMVALGAGATAAALVATAVGSAALVGAVTPILVTGAIIATGIGIKNIFDYGIEKFDVRDRVKNLLHQAKIKIAGF